MKELVGASMIIAASLGCGFDIASDELKYGSAHFAITTKALGSDINLTCSSSEVRAVDPDTEVAGIYMNAGDTLWVAGEVDIEYRNTSGGGSDKVFVQTHLACETETDASAGTTTPAHASAYQSKSGANQWDKPGVGTYLRTSHDTRTIYTATEAGYHTCWIIYSCAWKYGSTNLRVHSGTTTLKYYDVNQYPGKNFVLPGGNSQLIDDTTTHTPGGPEIWNAGTDSASDTELVVYWLPRLTNCEVADGECESIDPSFHGADADTYFDWRLVVYQLNANGVVCNKNFKNWHTQVLCRHHDHHCDVRNFSEAFPIVTGQGSEGACGGSSSSRRFQVFAQIRKYSGSLSDLAVSGGAGGSTARTNTVVYSR